VKRAAIDVSATPGFAFHHRALTWWGTMGIIVIEGMTFALLVVAYLYLKGRALQWPSGHFPPALVWGTVNTVLMLVSAVPNHLAKKGAERMNLRALRLWLAVALALAVAFMGIRVLEFQSLNVWWDENAYGSIVWGLLGLHSFHILTDILDSAVLLAVLYIGPLRESHFVDASDNAMYWNFVVVTWLPIYVLIYLVPRIW
jgi:heme/copper-type cytochrome/quinol oxidase subunit 3